MRRAALVGTVALLLALGGCGSDADHARETVQTYLQALANADGEKACDQLTGDARRDFISQSGEKDCAGAGRVIADQFSESEKDKLRNAKITVETKGDAKKQDTSNAAPGDLQSEHDKFAGVDAIAHVAGGDDVPLVKENGDYKIASISGAQSDLDNAFGP